LTPTPGPWGFLWPLRRHRSWRAATEDLSAELNYPGLWAVPAHRRREGLHFCNTHIFARMGVFKGLFVGVYASNRAIRVLFLPLCYFLLSFPFVLVLARYYQFDSKISNTLFKDRSLTDTLLQVFVGLVAFLLPTRILSGRTSSASQDGGKRRVQQLPYWIPGVRHWGNIVFGGEGWLKGIRYV
jgi:hypothetical protein